ncbi:MAG: hypothetical protein QHH15_04905, partial [Candidatus Thermoplasmatota archaeon]|nr:hypothetical protein [Candidatus Thermoplasmatota archaeon]
MEYKPNIKEKINKKTLTSITLFVLNTALVILAINLLSNNFAMFDTKLSLVSTIYILLAILIINIPFKKNYYNVKEKESFYKLTTGILLFISTFVFLTISTNTMIYLSAIAVFISGLNISLKAVKIKRKEFYYLFIFSLTYAIFYMLTQTIPVLWHIIQRFSLGFSNVIGLLIGKPMVLGPTVSSFWIIIIFLILLITCFIFSTNKKLQLKKFLFSTFTIIIIWIIYLIILGFIEFTSNSDVISLHYILFILCLIPTFFYLFKTSNIEDKTINLNNTKTKKIIKYASVYALIFLFLSSLILTSFIYLKENETNEKTKIMFYAQNMLGTWDIPEYGRYGQEASGMFGLLPIYLNASGFENTIIVDNITTFLNTTQPVYKNITRYVYITDYVKIIESKELKTDFLQDIDIFVVININKSFTPNEKQIIWDFVEKGGSLLVLGDHTNVGETQEPLNDLLTPVEISFRFDSALPLDSKFNWMNCHQFLHHPLTYNIKNFNEIQISVGASLNTSIDSIPFIIGRYSLSDKGDLENKDMSYLGDYKYNPGEQIGDTILAAAAYYKKGKVVVFGDTSTFQNSAIAYTYPFIYNIVKWLNSKETSIDTLLQNIVAIILLT